MNKNYSWPTTILAILSCLIPAYLIRFNLFGIPTTLWEVILWVSFIIFLIGKKIDFTKIIKDRFSWPILVILAGSLLAFLVTPDLRAGAGQWKALILDASIFYLMLISNVKLPKDYSVIAVGTLLGATVVALEALIFSHLIGGQVGADGRVIGLYSFDANASPNYLALYLSPIAATTFGWSLAKMAQKDTKKSLLLLVAACLLGLAVFQSDSRGGLLGLAAGLAVSLVLLAQLTWPKYKREIIWFSLAIVAIAAVSFIPQVLPNPYADPTASGRLSTSNNVRFEIWRTTVTTVLPTSPVLGIGWANFQDKFSYLTKTWINYPEYISPFALHPHNFWLMTLVTLGVIGLVGWLWLVIKILSIFLKKNDYQLLPLYAGLAAWFVHGLVDTTYYKNDLAAVFMLGLAGFSFFSQSKSLRSR